VQPWEIADASRKREEDIWSIRGKRRVETIAKRRFGVLKGGRRTRGENEEVPGRLE